MIDFIRIVDWLYGVDDYEPWLHQLVIIKLEYATKVFPGTDNFHQAGQVRCQEFVRLIEIRSGRK